MDTFDWGQAVVNRGQKGAAMRCDARYRKDDKKHGPVLLRFVEDEWRLEGPRGAPWSRLPDGCARESAGFATAPRKLQMDTLATAASTGSVASELQECAALQVRAWP